MEFCTIWKSELLVFEMEISWFLQAHLKSPVWVQSPDVKLTRLISMSRSCMPCPAVRVRAGNSTVPLGTSHHREDVPKDFWRQNLFYCLILETRLPSNTYLLAPVLESSLLLDQTAAHLHCDGEAQFWPCSYSCDQGPHLKLVLRTSWCWYVAHGICFTQPSCAGY